MVVIHIDDTRVRVGRVGNLVRVAGGRDAGADVEELPDASSTGQVFDCVSEKGPLSPDPAPRPDRDCLSQRQPAPAREPSRPR